MMARKIFNPLRLLRLTFEEMSQLHKNKSYNVNKIFLQSPLLTLSKRHQHQITFYSKQPNQLTQQHKYVAINPLNGDFDFIAEANGISEA